MKHGENCKNKYLKNKLVLKQKKKKKDCKDVQKFSKYYYLNEEQN